MFSGESELHIITFILVVLTLAGVAVLLFSGWRGRGS